MDENDNRDAGRLEDESADKPSEPDCETIAGPALQEDLKRYNERMAGPGLGKGAAWPRASQILDEQREQYRARVDALGIRNEDLPNPAMEMKRQARQIQEQMEQQTQEISQRYNKHVTEQLAWQDDQRRCAREGQVQVIQEGVGRVMATVTPRIDGLHGAVQMLIGAQEGLDEHEKKQERFNRRTTIVLIVVGILTLAATVFCAVVALNQ